MSAGTEPTPEILHVRRRRSAVLRAGQTGLNSPPGGYRHDLPCKINDASKRLGWRVYQSCAPHQTRFGVVPQGLAPRIHICFASPHVPATSRSRKSGGRRQCDGLKSYWREAAIDGAALRDAGSRERPSGNPGEEFRGGSEQSRGRGSGNGRSETSVDGGLDLRLPRPAVPGGESPMALSRRWPCGCGTR